MSKRGIEQAVVVAIPLLVLAGGACDMNEPVYLPGTSNLEVADGAGYGTHTVDLEFRRPSAGELTALREQKQKLTVQPRFDIPWLKRADIALSLQYTITNLSDRPGKVRVLIDGANEFTLYNPTAVTAALLAAGEEADEVYLPSLIEKTEVILAPGAKLNGNIREDDFFEAAADLDAFGRFMGNSTALLIYHSDENPLGLEMVPREVVTPQLNQLLITLVTDTRMRLDYVVRIRDEKGLLAEEGEQIFSPEPTEFVPAEYGMVLMDAMMVPAMPMP